MLINHVESVLNYGCEIHVQGFHNGKDVEKSTTTILENLLGVKKNTNSAVVYCETGRFPLKVVRLFRIFKFQFKLLQNVRGFRWFLEKEQALPISIPLIWHGSETRIELSTRDCLTLLLFLSVCWLLLFLSVCWLLLFLSACWLLLFLSACWLLLFLSACWLLLFLSACCFMSRIRMFHSHGEVTIPSQELPDFGIRSAPGTFEQALDMIVPHLL